MEPNLPPRGRRRLRALATATGATIRFHHPVDTPERQAGRILFVLFDRLGRVARPAVRFMTAAAAPVAQEYR